jgi:glycosyltransferase involved in cell wall biosynthesis
VIFLLRKSIAKQNLNLIIHWHSDLVGFHVLYYLFKNLEKFVIEKISTKIITTSHNYIDTSQVLMNSAARIRVIPNFLPVAIQNSHYSKCSEPRSKSFTMLCVGRNTKYKGYDKFIKNLYLMDSDFKLIIVGKDVKKLEKITKNSPYCNMIELKEDVNFNDLLKIYRSADIFVLPSVSRAEAFGIVLLEAMYFGLPSVVFNIPGSGVTEVIRNEINGLTADFLDYPHFFQCINEIRDNESLREQLVFNTKNVILEYDSDTICKRFVDVYNE